MKPTADPYFKRKSQRQLLDDKVRLLTEFIDLQHPLVLLANRIQWSDFEPHWHRRFSDASGPRAAPARLAAGLLLLKHMEGLSDEALMMAWVCNPYYQYFCGETHFQHKPPINPITLGRWRKQLGEEGLEYLYSAVLNTALKLGVVEAKNLAHVCVDSTVMEKHIAYPTDSNLLLKVLQKMVQFMQDNQLNVRQTYAREAPRLAQKIGRYAHAKQFKRIRSALKKLSTRVGRVMRELQRQLTQLTELSQMAARDLIEQAVTLRAQAKNPKLKDKLYALHEPEVDCISKAKAHKRYEFGVKVGIVCTQQEGFVIGMRSYPGNPYDGHTLDDMLQQTETITGVEIKDAAVDLGYRGRHRTQAKVIHRGRKLNRREKQRLKRRSMIEAMIGHMKQDGMLSRCHLKGTAGDAIHALLCGLGHNMRLLLNFIRANPSVAFILRLFGLEKRPYGAVDAPNRVIWAC